VRHGQNIVRYPGRSLAIEVSMDRLSCASVVFFAVSGYLGAQTLGNARDCGRQGIQQYSEARYQEAEASFEKALDLDPYDNAIRLYLAATYMAQWTPAASSDTRAPRNYLALANPISGGFKI